MADENQVTLTGRIAGAPVLRIGADNQPRLGLRVEVLSGYIANGVTRVHPNYFTIIIRGPRAESLLHKVRGGVRVKVEGVLLSFLRKDRSGNRFASISVNADSIDILEPENKSSVS